MNSTTPKIDIRPDHWEIVRDILHKHVPDYEVWVFGSRAKWTAKQYSDLDLAVITDKPLSLEVSANLSDDFSESDLPWKVDIVDWATTQDNFREIIKRDKVVVQKAKGWGMSADKEKIKLGDFVTLTTGHPFKSQFFSNEGIKLLRGDNVSQGSLRWENAKFYPHNLISEKVQNYLLSEGDIILAMDRPWIEAGLKFSEITAADLPCLLVQRVACLRAKDPLDQKFLKCVISSKSFTEYVLQVQTGTAVPHISGTQILDYEFQLLSEYERRKIGSINSFIGNKIHLNTQTNQTLEQIAQAIFKSWFVDFDPVKAKIAALEAGGTQEAAELAAMCVISGKDEAQLAQLKIQDADAYQQLAQTAALFPAAMQESDLGEIPEGWKTELLDDVGEFQNGFAFYTTGYSDSGFKVVDLANISTEGKFIETKRDKFISNEIYDLPKHEKHHLLKNDIVMAMTDITQAMGILGKCGKIYESNKFILNQRVGRIRVKKGMDVNFLLTSLNSNNQISFLKERALGSVQKYVNTNHIKEMPLIVPNEKLMKNFGQLVEPIFSAIRDNDIQNNVLENLRDSLLPKLLSGEIALSDAELI